MSEQIETAAAKALTPVAAALIEDIYRYGSEQITALEASLPARINAAEQDIQNWAHNAINTVHGILAHIDAHRGAVDTAQTAVNTPAPAPKPPAPTVGGSVPSTSNSGGTVAVTATTEAAK